VLFGDRHVSSTPDWRGAVNKLAESFAPERNADRELRRGADWTPHEGVLLRSAFSNLERISIISERSLGMDDIVGRAFSTSVTSPLSMGERTEEFEAELRAALSTLSFDGCFSEIVEVSGLIARRA
jgi:hypothetical protein